MQLTCGADGQLWLRCPASRLGSKAQRSSSPEAGRIFRFWFNSHHSVTEKAAAVKHMKSVEKLVAETAKLHGPEEFEYSFLTESSFSLRV